MKMFTDEMYQHSMKFLKHGKPYTDIVQGINARANTIGLHDYLFLE